jgi:hypothetical protein
MAQKATLCEYLNSVTLAQKATLCEYLDSVTWLKRLPCVNSILFVVLHLPARLSSQPMVLFFLDLSRLPIAYQIHANQCASKANEHISKQSTAMPYSE